MIAVISFVATGLAAGSTLLRAITVEATPIEGYAQHAFVGGAIVNGHSDPKITCSTGDSKSTNGLLFYTYTDGNSTWLLGRSITIYGAENKGGFIYDGKTNGKTYELKGKETHDGICQAKVPKNIIISGNCGTGEHKIHYETIRGLSHTFTGTVKCLGHTTNN
jgi:hypothetical protein